MISSEFAQVRKTKSFKMEAKTTEVQQIVVGYKKKLILEPHHRIIQSIGCYTVKRSCSKEKRLKAIIFVQHLVVFQLSAIYCQLSENILLLKTGKEVLIYAPSRAGDAIWEQRAVEQADTTQVMSVFITRGLALLPCTEMGCELGNKAGDVCP